jgi:hypothetical protein
MRWSAMRGRPAAVAAAGAVLAALTTAGCGAPTYRFETSAADDVIVKLPAEWVRVRSGGPTAAAAAGQQASTTPSFTWQGIFDANATPDPKHWTSRSVAAPVALLRSWTIPAATGAKVVDNDLRDLILPVSDAARADAVTSGSGGIADTFQLISEARVALPGGSGLRVTYSYDLGSGREVFDQVAVLDAAKTHVHLFAIHCNQACWAAEQRTIVDTLATFTVKKP